MKPRTFSLLRRVFWLSPLFLGGLEALSALIRAHFLPGVAFFQLPALYLGAALLKGLIFGPILGLLTLRIVRFWRQKAWDDACSLCLRGGSAIGGLHIAFAMLCFLNRARFPLFCWLASSPLHFAFWLTLNVAFLWALLLVVAGFLLPHDAHKTIQISDEVRF